VVRRLPGGRLLGGMLDDEGFVAGCAAAFMGVPMPQGVAQ